MLKNNTVIPELKTQRQQYRLYVTEFIILSLGEKDYDVQSKYIQCFYQKSHSEISQNSAVNT